MIEVSQSLLAMESQPNCAICNAPSYPECPCESERLTIAVRQAEQRALDTRLAEIREWVISHARTHILSDFNTRTATRKATHASFLAGLPYYNLYVQYAGRPPMHPAQLAHLENQIGEAAFELKRGIDADWRASVLRYPEVLDYFYSLVELRLPSDHSPAVLEPPFTLPASSHGRGGKRRSRRRQDSDGPSDGLVEGTPGLGRRRDSYSFPIPGRVKAPPVAPLPPPSQPHAAYGGRNGGGYYGY